MDDHDQRDVSGSTPVRPGGGSAHLMYVGILLVLIIGLLAILWARERRSRIAAEQKAANLQHRCETLQKAMAVIKTLQGPTTQPGNSQ